MLPALHLTDKDNRHVAILHDRSSGGDGIPPVAGQSRAACELEPAEALDRWVALKPTKADDLYNLACGHGVLVAALRKAQPEPNEDEKRREAKHVAAALATLRQAVAAGYSDFKHMATDRDLAPLRDLPEFKALLPQ